MPVSNIQMPGTNPYADWPVLDLWGWQLDFCWVQGSVRNLAVVADFNTMGAIACCICYYTICRYKDFPSIDSLLVQAMPS